MTLENICIILFIFFGFVSIHSYVLYPLSMRIISLFYKENYKNNSYSPGVSILISAFNEEKVISERISNILQQDYDLDKIEVLIGSDCSEDNTNKILLDLANRYKWLKIKIFNDRRGKAAVLNDLAKIAQNEILIFTDANTVFDKNALKYLVENFNDEKIGGVSGRLKLIEPIFTENESVEEKKYWEYETAIKKYEGRCGVLIGANGGIFAIRKKLFREIPIKRAVTDDFFISLSVLASGLKFIYVYKALAVEETGKSIKQEINRKIRFSATNFQTMFFFKDLLFSKNLLVSYAFISHKVLRWLFPFFLIVIFILNLVLINTYQIFYFIFMIQLFFYAFAVTGYLLSIFKVRYAIFSLPFFFVVSNCALLLGFFKFVTKKHSVIWQSTPR